MKSEWKGIFQVLKSVLPMLVIVIVALLSISLAIKAKNMQKEISEVSNDIAEIKQEQIRIAKKLDKLQDEIEQDLAEMQKDKHIEEQATRGWYRDVPLSESLQEYTAYVCGQYGVDYDIALAVMAVESNYKEDIVSANGQDYGLMQINRINHGWLADMGMTDMLDARQNIKAGVHILADLLDRYEGDYEMALAAYNCGVTGANKGNGKGYAEKVLKGVE